MGVEVREGGREFRVGGTSVVKVFEWPAGDDSDLAWLEYERST
jgi:hypothetical protein